MPEGGAAHQIIKEKLAQWKVLHGQARRQHALTRVDVEGIAIHRCLQL